MKHAPFIRLDAAKRAYVTAQEDCPHWDYEGDGAAHPCCERMSEAKEELRKAKKAMEP